MSEIGRQDQCSAIKVWGEMNPEQLWETTLSPQRILIKVEMKDALRANEILTILWAIK